MRAACITVPSRLNMLARTLATFGSARFGIFELDVFSDADMQGEYWNARRALEFLWKSGTEYVMLIEDDCEFSPKAGAALAEFQRNFKVGCISLATSRRDAQIITDRKLISVHEGWVAVDWAPYGTQCVVLSQDMLSEILDADFWRTGAETLDLHMFEVVLAQKESIWMHTPSLVHHTGWNNTTLQGKKPLTPELLEARRTC